MKKSTENLLSIAIAVLILIVILAGVGVEGVQQWLSEPFVWEETEVMKLHLLEKEVLDEEYIELTFLVDNRLWEQVEEYEYDVWLEGVQFTVESEYLYDAVDSWDSGLKKKTITIDSTPGFNDIPVEQAIFEKISQSDLSDLEFRYRTVLLEAEETGTIVNNSGTVKIIVLLVCSLVLGLLGLVQKFPVWLRIAFKICALPIVVVLALLYLLALGKSDQATNSTSKTSDNSTYREAQTRYNRAASQRAGAVQHGNRHSAAKAQHEMDRAMADMIGSQKNKDSSFREAQARYNRAASLKAGATITGRPADAAKAQAQMDRAMADMLKNK